MNIKTDHLKSNENFDFLENQNFQFNSILHFEIVSKVKWYQTIHRRKSNICSLVQFGIYTKSKTSI